ncbi:hypothetical protein [Chlorogloea sp. CCALA 695]|uniref:hypothetical protein n=1 Tax=Chlorogloea sp. CCALA 695 TaxID=2107693 RepID=UPI000D070B54|nr:hypothetical protein [Chlorogloea sp. CCALA 695]PSB28686.1 hypothetical protein C7B70_20450 [Chlorogloea sp. CCALA 695]
MGIREVLKGDRYLFEGQRSPVPYSGKQIMTYCTDKDQDFRLEQYAAIEEIYLSGITDAADGRFPQMSELCYLQGYVQGMRDYPRREVLLPVINTEVQEYPLLCSQCSYLNNGKCEIKSIARNGNQYACDRIVIYSPF